MSQNPYQQPMAASFTNYSVAPMKPAGDHVAIMQPLIDARRWLKFLGWMNIILGGLYCLTIVGIIFGWVPIWMGILLKSAGERLEITATNGDPSAAHYACRDLKTMFTIVGVLAIIWLVFTLLYILMVVLFLFLPLILS